MNHKPHLQAVLGQESWTLRSEHVEAALTRQGGHLGPVRFRLGGRWVDPFDVAPWAEERLASNTPHVLRVMRGDFFCMPFGANETEYRGERHPVHGDTANGKWKLESLTAAQLHVSMQTTARLGRVDKQLSLIPGQTMVYQQHIISGMRGRMCFGHHPILKVPEGATARVSVSPFCRGQVFPEELEDPAKGGYSTLQPRAEFTSLARVPLKTGTWADLSTWPAREGYEDLVQIAARGDSLAWTALTVPEERYVWFALKDPRVLPSTVFWMSHGGRHYPPWNGRHRRAIGLEEVCANFHYGLAESARPNAWTRAGVATNVQLDPQRPFIVNYIMGMAEIPKGFDIVRRICPSTDRTSATLVAKSGKTAVVQVDSSFLTSGPSPRSERGSHT